MGEISLVFDEEHEPYARTLAAEFRKGGFTVATTPSRLPACETYRQINYCTKLSNDANILLMGKQLYRRHRAYVEQFAEAIAAEQTNVHVISMDGEWYQIKDENVLRLREISYVQEAPGGGPLRSAPEIVPIILDRGAPTSSHLTLERFSELLQDSYDRFELTLDIREQAGRIAFSHFRCTHRVSGKLECYLVIYPTATLEAVKAYIDDMHPGLLTRPAPLYVVRSAPLRELTVRQRENTETVFGGIALRFESMVEGRRLRRNASPKLTDQGELLIPQRLEYTAPAGKVEVDAPYFLKFCAGTNNSYGQRRITILHGAGGGGKTHLVRFLNDELARAEKEVFFLSAASVADFRQEVTVNSLYDIYRCACLVDDEKVDIGKELFDLKFLVNDPVIIVDGLEEIISMLGDRFSLHRFYNDCIEKASGAANGRIIITTRENLWPAVIDPYVSAFDLLLFDEAQANEFFERSFPGDAQRATLAQRIYKDLGSVRQPPLFCSLIVLEIRNSASLTDLRNRLSRGDFRSLGGLDDFLRAIISRETKLGVEWPVDQLLAALGELARESISGPVALDRAKELFEAALPPQADVDTESAVKNFVFLEYQEATASLTFRYDFLKTVFLADYIVRCISELDMAILEDRAGLAVLARHLVPGSDVYGRISAAMSRGAPPHFFDVLECMIQDLMAGKAATKSEAQARTIASNLLFLRLALDSTIRDVRDSSAILARVFGDRDDPRILSKISLVLFGQDARRTYRFDLSDKIVRQAEFRGLPVDEVLEANEATVFSSSTFHQCVSEHPKRSASIWLAKFGPDCRFDDEFGHVISSFQATQENTLERKASDLKRFLRQFSAGHSFSRRRRRDALQGALNGIAVPHFVEVLKRHGFLEDVSGATSTQYQLTSTGSRHARQFVMDSAEGPEVQKIVKEL
jgi:hypothetical protein